MGEDYLEVIGKYLGEMRTYVRMTEADNREHGFKVCRDPRTGDELILREVYSDGMEVHHRPCPAGYETVLDFHTHTSCYNTPTAADVRSALRQRARVFCVGCPRSGIACYRGDDPGLSHVLDDMERNEEEGWVRFEDALAECGLEEWASEMEMLVRQGRIPFRRLLEELKARCPRAFEEWARIVGNNRRLLSRFKVWEGE